MIVEQLNSTQTLILNAIERLAGRGARPGEPPSAGQAVHDYLLDHLEEYTRSEVIGYLKNLAGAVTELRRELDAIAS